MLKIDGLPINKFCLKLYREFFDGKITREKLLLELNRALPQTPSLFEQKSEVEKKVA